MNPAHEATHWARLEKLFYAAIDLNPEQRSVLLDEQCCGDTDLRRDIESLLESSDKTIDF